MALPMDNLLPQTRKISVSFVSDIGPSVAEPTQTNNAVRLDPALKALQQRILRLQVSQVVLGLTLMILSAVAIIEDRVLFGLGFGLVSALIAVFSAAIGIQQCNLRFVAICNIIALIALFPTFFFVFENLIRHSRLLSIKSYSSLPPRSAGPDERMMVHHYNPHHASIQHNQVESEKSNNTLWILCWLELAHLVPLSASILYLLFLYRYLNYYTHF
ncbi:unnamed protein product [Orchesella dallaii]|uniref:Uncharacterized protein n=1 Tax=Orchesella dallaii TaxID=48710 RepID=A0ABP1RDL9_9HEXA